MYRQRFRRKKGIKESNPPFDILACGTFTSWKELNRKMKYMKTVMTTVVTGKTISRLTHLTRMVQCMMRLTAISTEITKTLCCLNQSFLDVSGFIYKQTCESKSFILSRVVEHISNTPSDHK